MGPFSSADAVTLNIFGSCWLEEQRMAHYVQKDIKSSIILFLFVLDLYLLFAWFYSKTVQKFKKQQN